MKYNIRDIFEYIIALVNEFAKRYCLTEKQAYRYIRAHKGIKFIEENYGAMHTLSFDDAVRALHFIGEEQEANYVASIDKTEFLNRLKYIKTFQYYFGTEKAIKHLIRYDKGRV